MVILLGADVMTSFRCLFIYNYFIFNYYYYFLSLNLYMHRYYHAEVMRLLLLEDINTYRPIPTDPTSKHKNRLVDILKNMTAGSGMSENTYKMMSPTGASAPKLYRQPKVHKKDVPLRSIVSSMSSVTYGVAEELARILKPLVGKTIYHVNNSKEFEDEIRNSKIEERECITSFDVTALFTSIPEASALVLIKDRLEQDTELLNRTPLSASYIIKLLGFCLNNSYFFFQNQFFDQNKGTSMGSSVSPIVANIFMEAFEHRAINIALNPKGSGGSMST